MKIRPVETEGLICVWTDGRTDGQTDTTKLRSRTFLSFNPLAFTHVPPDVTTSKLCEDLMFGNSV